ASPPGSSTLSTPAPGSCCGTSSAGAAITAARRPTASTESSTSPCRAGGAAGSRGSCPGCSGRHTEQPSSSSRCPISAAVSIPVELAHETGREGGDSHGPEDLRLPTQAARLEAPRCPGDQRVG